MVCSGMRAIRTQIADPGDLRDGQRAIAQRPLSVDDTHVITANGVRTPSARASQDRPAITCMQQAAEQRDRTTAAHAEATTQNHRADKRPGAIRIRHRPFAREP